MKEDVENKISSSGSTQTGESGSLEQLFSPLERRDRMKF